MNTFIAVIIVATAFGHLVNANVGLIGGGFGNGFLGNQAAANAFQNRAAVRNNQAAAAQNAAALRNAAGARQNVAAANKAQVFANNRNNVALAAQNNVLKDNSLALNLAVRNKFARNNNVKFLNNRASALGARQANNAFFNNAFFNNNALKARNAARVNNRFASLFDNNLFARGFDNFFGNSFLG